MSFLYVIVFCLFIFGAISNFKKTILLWVPLKLVFHSGIYLFDNSSGRFTLNGAVSFFLMTYFFIFIRKRENEKYIFTIPFLLYLLHLCLFYFYPRLHIPFFISTFSNELGMAIVFFYCLKEKDDIDFVVKCFMIIGYILMVNGFIELLFSYNPIYEIFRSNGGIRFWWSENTVMRFGMPRITSFMPHAISFGTTCNILIILFAYLLVEHPEYLQKKIIHTYLLLIMLLGGVILSNSRTCLAALVAGLLFFIRYKTFKGIRGFFTILIILVFIFVFSDYLQFMYDTVFHEDQVDVQGSTSELRKSQFEVSLFLLLQSPVCGNGIDYIVQGNYGSSQVAGMESVWFPIMYQSGLLGVFTYLFLYLYIIYRLKSIPDYRYILSFLLMWIISFSLSSQVGFGKSLYFYLIIILIYRISSFTTRKEYLNGKT